MNEQLQPMASTLPAAAFLVPLAAGALIFAGRALGRRSWEGLSVLSAVITLGVGIAMAKAVVQGAVLTCWGNELRVDGLSAFMVVVVTAVSLLACVYSIRYVSHALRPSQQVRLSPSRRLWIFYGLLQWFIATMVWGCVTNNVIMLYVAVEATTLTSGLLVAFYWDRRALEAGYKYLMLLTIGITFALFGCVLVYAGAASTGAVDGGNALLLSEVRAVAPLIPAATAAIAMAMLVVGFGTKAGLAPFHPWLPDAHAEAPTSISVLLSAVMIKMAVYALARTVSIFFPVWPAASVFAVALGAFTMLLGIVLAMTQDDLKRLLAYSSVSQMGYVVVGVGLGTYLGCYGGLFHLLNHAICKALLFMCAGAIIYATGLRRLTDLGGLRKKMPVTSACFFLGALAIAGFPPLNVFMSKLTVFLALGREGMWWALAIALVTGVLTMVVLVRAATALFWSVGPRGDAAVAEIEVREVPASMWCPMVVLAGATVLLGLFPQAAYPLLDKAAAALATLGR